MSPLSALPRRFRRLLGICLSGLALYAALGFWALPALIQSQVPKRLGPVLKRPVSLRKARFNPFTFALTLEGFRVGAQDDKALLGWERMYANWQLSSLFQGGLTFKAITLEHPYGRLLILKDGSLSIADLLQSDPKAPAQPASAPLDLRIAHLKVSGARFEFQDLSRSQPFATTLGPLGFEVENFRTQRDHQNPYQLSGRTESGEAFAWSGSFSTEPPGAQGRLRLERLKLAKYAPYYQDQVGFELRDGLLDLELAYRVHWEKGKEAVVLSEGHLVLDELRVGEAGVPGDTLTLPRLEVKGAHMDALAPSLDLAEVKLQGGNLDLQRGADGHTNLERLLKTPPSPKQEPSKPLALHLAKLALEGFSIKFRDAAIPRPVDFQLEGLTAGLEDFSLDPRQESKLTFSTRIGAASLSATGSGPLLATRLKAKLKLENLDLVPFDAYLEPATALRLGGGKLGVEGQVELRLEGKKQDGVHFQGQVNLEHLEAMDAAQREPFLRYRALRLKGLDVDSAPQRVSIQAVQLEAPEHRLVVSSDGSTNVARALKLAPAAPTGAAAPPTSASAQAAPMPLSIQRIELRKGRLSFIDRSLQPEGALLITDLEGRYVGLSSSSDARSEVDLKGLAGGLAPLTITGHAMPLRHDQDTDIAVKLRGAELTDFTPYAIKYLGYGIRKGKLDTEAHIRITKRQLQAENRVRLDQFYLGDKVPSPEATKLPVKLGLALLRDRKGVIDFDVPVSGSLDDPDIHYGKMVWKVIGNLFTKLVTSPFSALGKLFGAGDQDLSYMAFAPGLASPESEEGKKLDALVRALQERPDLSLELEGLTEAAVDTAGLRRLSLEASLRDLKAQSLKEPNPEAVSLSPEERPRWLKAAFEKAFPPAPQPEKSKEKTPPPADAEMEQRLLATVTVSPEDLRRLADARAKGLIEKLRAAQVAPERIFEVEGGERAKKEGGPRVYFGLR